jgi:PAS domain S-box-containing protein
MSSYQNKSRSQLISELQDARERNAYLEDELERFRKTEQSSQGNKDRDQVLFENVFNGIAVFEPVENGNDFVLVDLNQQGARIQNVERKKVIGKRITDVFSGVYDIGFLDILQRVFFTGKSELLPLIYYHDDKVSGWRKSFICKSYSGELVTIFSDQTERKLTEQALYESETFNKVIVDESLDCITLLDLEGHLLFMNRGGRDLLEIEDIDPYLGQSWVLFWQEKDQEYIKKSISKAVNGGIGKFEAYGYTMRGELKWWNVIISLLPQIEDSHKRLLAIARDNTDNKKAQKNLQLLSELIDNSEHIAVLKDTSLQYLLVNQAYLRLTGYDSSDKVMGKTDAELFRGLATETQIQEYMDNDRRALQLPKGQCLTVEEYFPGEGDQTRTFLTKKFPLFDSSQEVPIGVATLTSEITEQKKVEEKIKESVEAYRNLFQNAQVGLFKARIEDGKILECNKQLAKMFGYNNRKKILEDFIASEHYVDPVTRKQLMREIQEKGEITNFEARLYCKDRSICWILFSARIYPEKGYIEGVAENITHLKQTQQALQESEEKYKKLINTSPDAIALADASERFLTVNPSMAKRFNMTQRQLEGTSFYEVMPKDMAVRRIEKGRQAIEQNELVYFEDERNGLHLQNYFVPVSTSNTQRTYQIISRDISDIKHTEDNLKQTLGELNQAVHGIFHALSSALEQRDAYTAGHQERVTQLACAIARDMALEEDRIQGLYFAGMVHDIGKISIPAEILTKPSKLNQIEFALIQEHVRAGYDILKGIEFPWPIADIVLQHHERIDGSGYPQGLRQTKILLEARILAVADVIEAMSSHRPYRPGLGIAAALEEIENKMGVLYDKDVATICLKLFREKGYQFGRD